MASLARSSPPPRAAALAGTYAACSPPLDEPDATRGGQQDPHGTAMPSPMLGLWMEPRQQRPSQRSATLPSSR
eukprot:scaffold4973_cov175-Prasinococcus_capsulatus_cf.AAC.1